MEEYLLEKWLELKTLVDTIEMDLHRSVRGNRAAGLRLRRGLRKVRSSSLELTRTSLKYDSALEESRRAKKAAKKKVA